MVDIEPVKIVPDKFVLAVVLHEPSNKPCKFVSFDTDRADGYCGVPICHSHVVVSAPHGLELPMIFSHKPS